MPEVFVLAARRTAVGRFGGVFKDVSARQLGIEVVKALLAEAGVEPSAVDEVIMGNARPAGNGPNLARQIACFSGVPVEKTAFTVNKACGSGLKTVMLGYQAIVLGDADIVIAGGTEAMSRAPYLLEGARWGYRLGNSEVVDSMHRDGYLCPMADVLMGMTAEFLAAEYSIGRQEQDVFAYESQMKTKAAMEAGRFDNEIVPLSVPGPRGTVSTVKTDEHPRPDTTLEVLARLRPAFKEGGTVTAGNSSGMNDAAAALLLASGEAVKAHALHPIARIVGYATGGVEPRLMGLGPVPALRRLSTRSPWPWEEAGLLEVNEAFAAQVLACYRELKWNPDVLNVNGGAIALGHPTAASGARVATTLLHEMIRRKVERGVATLCVSGGQGVACAFELVN